MKSVPSPPRIGNPKGSPTSDANTWFHASFSQPGSDGFLRHSRAQDHAIKSGVRTECFQQRAGTLWSYTNSSTVLMHSRRAGSARSHGRSRSDRTPDAYGAASPHRANAHRLREATLRRAQQLIAGGDPNASSRPRPSQSSGGCAPATDPIE